MQPYLPISHFLHEHLNTYAESKHLLLHPTQHTGLSETWKLQLSKPLPCAITHKSATCETLWIATLLLQRETNSFSQCPPTPNQIMFKEKDRRGKKGGKADSTLFFSLLELETRKGRTKAVTHLLLEGGGHLPKSFCNNQCNSKIMFCYRLLWFHTFSCSISPPKISVY